MQTSDDQVNMRTSVWVQGQVELGRVVNIPTPYDDGVHCVTRREHVFTLRATTNRVRRAHLYTSNLSVSLHTIYTSSILKYHAIRLRFDSNRGGRANMVKLKCKNLYTCSLRQNGIAWNAFRRGDAIPGIESWNKFMFSSRNE